MKAIRLKTALAACVLAGGAVLAITPSASAATPAPASPPKGGTPGSTCYLGVAAEAGGLRARGTVAEEGAVCVPLTPLPGPWTALNVGVPCGTTVDVPLTPPVEVKVFSYCPN